MALSEKISWIKYSAVTIFYFRLRYTKAAPPPFRQVCFDLNSANRSMTMARTSELWTQAIYIHKTVQYLHREGAQLVANNKHIIIQRLWEEEKVAKGGHIVCSTTWFTYPAERRDTAERGGVACTGAGVGAGISCAFASSKFARKVANLAKNSKHAAVNTWGFNWLIGYLWLCVAWVWMCVCVWCVIKIYSYAKFVYLAHKLAWQNPIAAVGRVGQSVHVQRASGCTNGGPT